MMIRRFYWLLWLLVTGGLYFFENNTATRIIFASSVLIPCLSLLCTFWCAERVHFELTAPATLPENTGFFCRISASGSKLLPFALPGGIFQISSTDGADICLSKPFSCETPKMFRLRTGSPGTFAFHISDPVIEDRFGLCRIPVSASIEKQFFIPTRNPDANNTGSGGNGNQETPNSMPDLSAYNGIREYIPGDPIRAIHWKLSAKTGRILIREADRDPEAETSASADNNPKNTPLEAGNSGDHFVLLSDLHAPNAQLRKNLQNCCIVTLLLCIVLIFLLPQARLGTEALCNRLFSASEALNAYAYQYFEIPAGQSTVPASILLGLAGLCMAGIALTGKAPLFLLLTAALTAGFQAYFGLPFPLYLNIPIFAVLGWLLLRGKLSRKLFLFYLSGLILTAVIITAQYPGVDPWIETRSESLRDKLTIAADLTDSGISETDEKTETRHVNSRSLITGENESNVSREFRPVIQEKEQISLPEWAESLSLVLPYIIIVLVSVFFIAGLIRFVLRRIDAAEARKRFSSADNTEAILTMFRHTARWLDFFGYGSGNLSYRDWSGNLRNSLSESYADQFSQCVPFFEEALYSEHMPDAEKVEAVRSLLNHTEDLLYNQANRSQRLRLKFTECLL